MDGKMRVAVVAVTDRAFDVEVVDGVQDVPSASTTDFPACRTEKECDEFGRCRAHQGSCETTGNIEKSLVGHSGIPRE